MNRLPVAECITNGAHGENDVEVVTDASDEGRPDCLLRLAGVPNVQLQSKHC